MPTFDRPQYTPEQEQQATERKEVLEKIDARGLLASAVNGGNIIEVERVGHTVFHGDGEPTGEYFINGYFDTVSGLGVFVNSVTSGGTGTKLIVGIGYAEGYTLNECILHAAAMARMRVGEIGSCVGNLVDGGIEQVFYEDKYSGKKYRSYYTFDQMRALTEEALQRFKENTWQVWQEYERQVLERQTEDERGKTGY